MENDQAEQSPSAISPEELAEAIAEVEEQQKKLKRRMVPSWLPTGAAWRRGLLSKRGIWDRGPLFGKPKVTKHGQPPNKAREQARRRKQAEHRTGEPDTGPGRAYRSRKRR